jgi:hypothetical protein
MKHTPGSSTELAYASTPARLLAWFKNGFFGVTRAIELLPTDQWNFSFPVVIPVGEMLPIAQARSG